MKLAHRDRGGQLVDGPPMGGVGVPDDHHVGPGLVGHEIGRPADARLTRLAEVARTVLRHELLRGESADRSGLGGDHERGR